VQAACNSVLSITQLHHIHQLFTVIIEHGRSIYEFYQHDHNFGVKFLLSKPIPE
jgi:hypothetical protein